MQSSSLSLFLFLSFFLPFSDTNAVTLSTSHASEIMCKSLIGAMPETAQ